MDSFVKKIQKESIYVNQSVLVPFEALSGKNEGSQVQTTNLR